MARFTASAAQTGSVEPSAHFVIAVLVASALLLAGSLWSASRERNALLRMSPEVRARVYSGALANLKDLCPPGTRAPELEKRCTEQALFLAQFPECDAECLELLRSNLPKPTR